MAGRRRKSAAPSSSIPVAKKKRRTVLLATKLEIIKLHEEGTGPSAIAHKLNLPVSTVGTVMKDKDKLKKRAQAGPLSSASYATRLRDPYMEDMEAMLKVWIDNRTQQHMPLSLAMIREKARILWREVRDKGGESASGVEFTASRGWFHRFRQRAGLHSIKFTGEAASADKLAAASYPAEFKSLVEEGGFTAKQVFNVDETGLFWKKLSGRTYISVEEKSAPGFKVSKDRLTLLLGGNAYGDVKLKPLLVYHSENPRALKGCVKGQLPVVWKSNPKAWVTQTIFQDYVFNYFSPFVERYTRENNLANKALLVVDNAPGHPPHMEDWCENVQVAFLPPNTTSVLQPMDQGAIYTFKAYYTRRVMRQLLHETDGEDKMTIREFWKQYNIKKALENIKLSWDEMTNSTMNHVWRKLWPECVNSEENDFEGFENVCRETAAIANQAGFHEVDEQDINELLDSHAEELSTEDLLQLHEANKEKDSSPSLDSPPVHQLTSRDLCDILAAFENALEIVFDKDPNLDRSSNVRASVMDSIACYQEMYKAKKKKAIQPSLHAFFSSKISRGTTESTPVSPTPTTSSGLTVLGQYEAPSPSAAQQKETPPRSDVPSVDSINSSLLPQVDSPTPSFMDPDDPPSVSPEVASVVNLNLSFDEEDPDDPPPVSEC